MVKDEALAVVIRAISAPRPMNALSSSLLQVPLESYPPAKLVHVRQAPGFWMQELYLSDGRIFPVASDTRSFSLISQALSAIGRWVRSAFLFLVSCRTSQRVLFPAKRSQQEDCQSQGASATERDCLRRSKTKAVAV